jgi:hypothetical protein
MQPNLRNTLIDIVLNIAVPFGIYTVARRYFGLSDVYALTWSSIYPVFEIIFEYLKDRTLNFISVIVLIGTVTGVIGALIGGNPRLILIRESFFTLLLGLGCFVSLFVGRPLLFYFAREFQAGKNSQKRKEFTNLLQNPKAFSLFRMLTVVWGIVYVAEFILKVIIVYTFSISLNLIIAPLITNLIIFATIYWTFWYVKHRRKSQNT